MPVLLYGSATLPETKSYAKFCFEQILESALNKTAVVRLLTHHLTNHPSKTDKICWRTMDNLISDQQRCILISFIWTLAAIWRTCKKLWTTECYGDLCSQPDSMLYMYIHMHIYFFVACPEKIFSIIILLIIRSCCQHRFPWRPLSINLYHTSLSAGLRNYILCPLRADVCKSLMISQHWHVHMSMSLEKCHLWVRPCFSGSILNVLFVFFGWFMR